MALALFGDDLLSPFLGGHLSSTVANSNQYGRSIPIDISETEREFSLKADVPGVSKDHLKVYQDGDVLSISAENKHENKQEKEEKGVKYHRVERSSSFVKRSIRMPDSADLTQIKAAFKDGTLHLTIPKKEKEINRNRQIAIE
jgi:HSP20 family protein